MTELSPDLSSESCSIGTLSKSPPLGLCGHSRTGRRISKACAGRPAGRRGAGPAGARGHARASPPKPRQLAFEFVRRPWRECPPASAIAAIAKRSAPRSIMSSATAFPSDKPLRDGDIVNIDVTVIVDGWHGDTSRMYVVGEVQAQGRSG